MGWQSNRMINKDLLCFYASRSYYARIYLISFLSFNNKIITRFSTFGRRLNINISSLEFSATMLIDRSFPESVLSGNFFHLVSIVKIHQRYFVITLLQPSICFLRSVLKSPIKAKWKKRTVESKRWNSVKIS